MFTLPATVPKAYAFKPGQTSAVIVDTGGYDFMVGGQGFRLATDQTFPYVRQTEPTTVQRFDSNQDPGEQSLSPLPWIKSQESFHGGAGQLNLEHGRSTFQYQQEQIDHIRFDTCQGVDVWTPGTVARLPDAHFFNFGFTSTVTVTATVGGIDYAVIGGLGGLYMASWPSGPDASPVVTAVDLSGSTFGDSANCNITSITTDGVSYYALVQLVTVAPLGSPSVMTYVISGPIGSTAPPNILYTVPQSASGLPRTNLCTNPSFGLDTTGWSNGQAGASLAQSSAQSWTGGTSMKAVWGTSAAQTQSVIMSFATTPGRQYALSGYVYVPSGNPRVAIGGTKTGFLPAAGAISAPSSVLNNWQRLYATYTATSATSQIVFQAYDAPTAGQFLYIDAVLIEDSPSLGSYFAGGTTPTSTYTFSWNGASNESTSLATPIGATVNVPGVVGWAKERLVGGLGQSIYELALTTSGFAPLPAPRYTHPVSACTWTAVSESPQGILVANLVGGQSAILEFTLDATGGTPVLSGGASIASLPTGEQVLAMQSYLASFLGVGTSSGVRVGTFDTYTGALNLGPLTVSTTAPVLAIDGRDRFIYAGYTNQQADGKTGLVRLDLSMVTDTAGRLAYAPDLRPPTTAPTGLGAVTGLALLPTSDRLIFVTPEGIHVEGSGPGSDGAAWLRTSRIRYDTAELKLFKRGRVHGSLASAEIQITGITPYGVGDQNLGTYGFVTGTDDPGEFLLPAGLHPWIQLQFSLIGSTVSLDSYQVKALPAPKRQHIIQVTGSCFTDEIDRFGLEVTDPVQPRQRYQNVLDMEAVGDEVTFVEFTNFGAVAEAVVIDQIQYQSFARPTIEDDFGGWITFKMRSTA
jgi:hypothetical protein